MWETSENTLKLATVVLLLILSFENAMNMLDHNKFKTDIKKMKQSIEQIKQEYEPHTRSIPESLPN
jgi:ABC-type cobalt transport system substrate-binding protein